MTQFILIAVAYCIMLLMAFAVAEKYLRQTKEFNISDLKKGQKIMAMYKDQVRAAKITINHSDIKVIYAKTVGSKPVHLRLEYKDILEVVK